MPNNKDNDSSWKDANDDSDLSWKDSLPVIFVMLLVIVLVLKFVVPALQSGDHRPSSIIEDITNKEVPYLSEE